MGEKIVELLFQREVDSVMLPEILMQRRSSGLHGPDDGKIYRYAQRFMVAIFSISLFTMFRSFLQHDGHGAEEVHDESTLFGFYPERAVRLFGRRCPSGHTPSAPMWSTAEWFNRLFTVHLTPHNVS